MDDEVLLIRDRLESADPVAIDETGLLDDVWRSIVDRLTDDGEIPAPAASPSGRRRRGVLVAAAVAAVVALAAGINLVGGNGSAGARELAPLEFDIAAGDASAQLRALAATAEAQPEPTGSIAYQRVTVGGLHQGVSSEVPSAALVSTTVETWESPQGVRSVRRTAESAVDPDASIVVDPDVRIDGKVAKVGAGRSRTPVPTNADALRDVLEQGGGDAGTEGERLWTGARDVLTQRPLAPRETAAVLRQLATIPEVRSLGTVRDRAGRLAQGFELTSTISGSEVQSVLLLDPATASLLGQEEYALADSGGLPYEHYPAVLSFRVVLASGFVDTVGRTPS